VSRPCIIVFARAPEKGLVKTRLAKKLPPDTVLSLYKCFVADVLDAIDTELYHIRICFFPAYASGNMIQWFGSQYDYIPQEGCDIGQRMLSAFSKTFSDGFNPVLLIGSDIPALTSSIVHQACDALLRTDAVIGPSHDGGYYLIGFNSDTFQPDVFNNMPWSSPQVFSLTLSRLTIHCRRVHILPVCQDIDEPDDLISFVRSASPSMIRSSHTLRYLKQILNR